MGKQVSKSLFSNKTDPIIAARNSQGHVSSVLVQLDTSMNDSNKVSVV